MKTRFASYLLLAFALAPGLSLAGTLVSQPYRPAGESGQWTIEGQTYGLLKVKVLINGQVVADGAMKSEPFSSTYEGRAVRVSCSVGSARFSGPADQSCAVYVGSELAANLVFVRHG